MKTCLCGAALKDAVGDVTVAAADWRGRVSKALSPPNPPPPPPTPRTEASFFNLKKENFFGDCWA